MNIKKSIFFVLLGIVCWVNATAQNNSLSYKSNNYSSFSTDVYIQHADLAKFTDTGYYHHPDYGKVTPNWSCKECVELLQYRTPTSRYYITLGLQGNEFYKQESYFPLHYRDSSNQLVSIEYNLKPLSEQVYAALKQPVQTYFDASSHTVMLKSDLYTIQFGSQLSIYSVGHFDQKHFFMTPEGQDYSHFNAGDDGVFIHNIKNNVDIEYNFKKGAIKTTYILRTKPILPKEDKWLIVEVPLTLSPGQKIIKNTEGSYTDPDGNYNGGYDVVDEYEYKEFNIEKPVFYDANYVVYPAYYELKNNEGQYSLLYKIPLSDIYSSQFTFPLMIDPYVTGYNKFGNYKTPWPTGSPALPKANMNFTYYLRGECQYFMIDTVPGKSDIVETYVEIEDENTLSTTCNSPPVPLPSCRRHDISHTFTSDECGTRTGLAAPPLPAGEIDTPGTVTTDGHLVRGAGPILIDRMLDCVPPQCPDFYMHFTLGNIENKCNDLCNNNCARGNMWAVTIRARRLEGTLAADRLTVCAGEPIVLTATPSWGVPPYHYVWSTGDTSRIIVVRPEDPTTTYTLTIYDTCNVPVNLDIDLFAIPSPNADAGVDVKMCEGGTATLGGAPAISAGSARWTSNPGSAISYLSGTTAENPNVTIPPGVTGVFTYILKATDFRCFRYDTMKISSNPNPMPYIIPDTGAFICEGGSIELTTTQPFSAYSWSSGGTSRTETESQPGTYTVEVTDNNGCKGISNPVTLDVKPVFTVLAYPDTTIDPEASAGLYSDIDLRSVGVDSFYWSPPTFLSCDTCIRPVSSPSDDIVYYLHVLSDGCWTEDSAVIKINYPFDFYVPNAFTPNGDGYNDEFFYIGSKVLTAKKFQIYDRYGEKLWDLPIPWTGIYKAQFVPPGVYVYYLEVEFRGEVHKAKGSVTVIR